MSTLQIKKLQSGAFEHVDSIDGNFFLGRFSFKQEFNKAFLVEAYGAKRREYTIEQIEVFDYLGTAETFTNFTDLENRLVELAYTGIETNGIIPTASSYISSDVNNALELGADNKLFVPIVGGNNILVTNASVSGTYNLDFSKDTFELTLVGNTTLTVSNLPSTGNTKVISVYMTGNFAVTYPSGFTTRIVGTYNGAKNNLLAIEYRGATNAYWVTIVTAP
jgi:hypothetical protein